MADTTVAVIAPEVRTHYRDRIADQIARWHERNESGEFDRLSADEQDENMADLLMDSVVGLLLTTLHDLRAAVDRLAAIDPADRGPRNQAIAALEIKLRDAADVLTP